MAHTLVINEGTLNDDELLIAENGKCFNGHRKWIFCVNYWTFRNDWCNDKHVFFAETAEQALKRYKRETKRAIENEDELLALAYEF